MRILMVTGVYPTPRKPHAGTFIASQVESLRAIGVDVDVLHPAPGPSWQRYLSTAIGVFCKTLTKRYDIVHGHYSLWSLIARLQWTTPVIASYLGDDVLGTVTATGAISKSSRKIVALSRALSRWVDAVIVKSEGMRTVLNGPVEKVFVLPNGVDFARFRPIPREEAQTELSWSGEKCYVLFGNDPAIPVKNFPLARRVVEILQAQGIPVELIVAKGLSHELIPLYINACNVLLLTSIAEGSPNIVKEAMACNVPVVATDVGDVAAVISRTNGCSVCSHDAHELAQALKQALHHTQPTSGRQDISFLENTCVAQRLRTLYEQVIQRSVTFSQNSLQPLGAEKSGM